MDQESDYWLMNTGPVGCPETSAKNYHYSLDNNPEERSSYVFVDYIVGVHINLGPGVA